MSGTLLFRTVTFLPRVASRKITTSPAVSVLPFQSRTVLRFSRLPSSLNVHLWGRNHLISIHTSSTRSALPPAIFLVLSKAAQFGSAFVGHSARNWWQNLTPEQKAAFAARARRNRFLLLGILSGLSVGAYFYYVTHLEETPITKRKRFLAISHEQFDEMSKEELKKLISENKKKIVQASADNPLYKRISGVVQKLLAVGKAIEHLPTKDWTITVIDDDEQCNAHVLPCGSIFVFSGILNLCETDDELAIILGHEIAHAILGHGAEKASFLHFLDSLMVVPLAVLWAILPTDLTAILGHSVSQFMSNILMHLPHSRFIEDEADQVGLLFVSAACYDVRQAPTLWRKMRFAEESDPDDDIEWLSTHPTHEHREATLRTLIPEALELRNQCKYCPELPPYDAEQRFTEYTKKLLKTQKYLFRVPV